MRISSGNVMVGNPRSRINDIARTRTPPGMKNERRVCRNEIPTWREMNFFSLLFCNLPRILNIVIYLDKNGGRRSWRIITFYIYISMVYFCVIFIKQTMGVKRKTFNSFNSPELFTDRVCQIATLRSQRRCYLKYMSSDARHRVCGCGSSPQMPCNEADVVARSVATRQSHAFGESSWDRHASLAMTILS